MSVRYLPPGPPPVIYPDTDGKPMAENTRQAEWIVTLFGNLDMLFRDRPDVFVAMDNFIYPVEGDPSIATAPDVYVVFGRPKGHRASYKVWAEEGIFPQVVCEVLSPSNSAAEMSKKLRFYQQYGADEYYVYDAEADELEIWLRENGRFTAVPNPNGFVSPRLGIRFVLPDDGPMIVYRPDGQRFLTFVELGTLAEQEKQRAEQEKQRADRLAAKLRELGWDPDAL